MSQNCGLIKYKCCDIRESQWCLTWSSFITICRTQRAFAKKISLFRGNCQQQTLPILATYLTNFNKVNILHLFTFYIPKKSTNTAQILQILHICATAINYLDWVNKQNLGCTCHRRHHCCDEKKSSLWRTEEFPFVSVASPTAQRSCTPRGTFSRPLSFRRLWRVQKLFVISTRGDKHKGAQRVQQHLCTCHLSWSSPRNCTSWPSAWDPYSDFSRSSPPVNIYTLGSPWTFGL